MKLFNVIQQSQAAATVATEQSKAMRGTGKPTLPAPVMNNKSQSKKAKNKDNIIGRGKESMAFRRFVVILDLIDIDHP